MHVSIRSKLTIAFLIVLLPFIFLEVQNIRERTAAGRQSINDNLAGSARTAAATMDAYLAEVIRKLQTAAQVVSTGAQPSVDEMNASFGQIRAPGAGTTIRILPVPLVIPKLEALNRSLQPFAQFLAYVDSRGKVTVADPPSLVGQDLSADPALRAVLQQSQVWAESGLEPVMSAAPVQEPGFVICLGLRVPGPGDAVCAGIASSSLRDVLPAVAGTDQLILLDNQSQLIYSSAHDELPTAQRDWSGLAFVSEAQAGQASTADFVSPIDHEAYLGAQTRISSLGWMAGVYRLRETALASLQASTRSEGILFGLAAILLLALTQALATVIVQPIVELTAHARLLSKGDLKRRITIASGDETQTLAETFNKMAENLDHTVGDLVSAREEIARQSEQLQQLLVRTNAVQEDERRRIAFDIHDGVIQLVIAAGYELQAAGRQVGNGKAAEAQRKLDRARQLMDQTVVEMRRIVFDLHPTSLDSRGLVTSLEKYAASWQESAGIACSFTVDGEPIDLPPEAKVGVYRIVQEALTNIRKHAGADTVQICAAFAPGSLRLSIEDDGAGFSLDEVRSVSGHLGLMSMSERARTLGGQIDIQSHPGHGTRLVLNLPI